MKTGYHKRAEYAACAAVLLLGILHTGTLAVRAVRAVQSGTDHGTQLNVQKHSVPAPQDASISQSSIYGTALSLQVRRAASQIDSIESKQTLASTGFALSSESEQAVTEQLDLITSRGYSATFVLVDMQTGHTLEYKSHSPRYSASAIKGPVVLADAALGHLQQQTDDSLVQQTISISDNDAYAQLVERYGLDPLARWTASPETSVNLDAEVGIGTAKYMWLSAADLTKMWLLGYDYLFGETDRSAEWFAQPFAASQNSFIRDALSGSDASAYTKAGWIHDDEYFTAQNDAGIIRTDHGDVVLTVLSDAYGEYDLLSGLVRALVSVHGADMR